MKCSIIVVTYNGKEVTKILLDQLTRELRNAKDNEVIVWDNNSQDGLKELLKNYLDNANWKIFLHEWNLGFAGGNNEAAKYAEGEYIFLLNPDTEIKKEDIRKMTDYLDSHPKVGIIGPRMIDEAGVVQESFGEDMTPFSEFVGKFWGSLYLESIPVFRKLKEKKLNRRTTINVGWIGGAGMMIRSEIWRKIGGIDVNFFYSAGDMVDVGKKVRDSGWEIIYFPEVTIIHKGSKTIAGNRTKALEKSYEGTLYYFKKHHGAFTVLVVKVVYCFASLVKGIIASSFSIFKREPFLDIAKSHLNASIKIVLGKIK
ncbi:glycosyltransferase family 2 protein [Patescibacteria group bacterium]|nr:glycosyltransferase family 2 protein [Patescibacteria group bacterium]